MKTTSFLRLLMATGAAAGALLAFQTVATAAGPEVVSGPAAEPDCFAPWSADTKFLKYPAKKGPFRIALANGYIANTWRIQMIQTAKAYAAQKDVAAKLKEFKVVSTGEDVPAQISAINNFIDFGDHAIVVDAQNPTAFEPVIKRAKQAGVILVAFDNILDTTDDINVNVDQKGLGVLWAKWLVDHLPNGGKVLEVRGVAGTSVDTDRHNGIHETFDASGKTWNVTEVMGKWDDGVAQKVTADAIATNGPFDGITAQGGDTGVVQAMLDAKHPMVPFGGETENGFRKFCAKYSADGLKCTSAGTGPAQVAVAIKTAIAALEGQVVPQSIKLPLAVASDPNFKEGVDYFPTESRQLLRRKILPHLRHQFHGAGNHGPVEGKPVESHFSRCRAPRASPAAPCAIMTILGNWGGADGERCAALSDGRGHQALWRRPGARPCRTGRRARPHPRHPRRERRRQIDAHQDHGRRRRARRGTHDAGWPRGSLPYLAAANHAWIVWTSRNCRWSRT